MVIIRVLIATILACALEACGSGDNPAPSYGITGTVTGAVASGVTVTLNGGSNKSTITDSTGKYSITGLANGNYVVTPSLAGYSFDPFVAAVTVNGANASNINFTSTAVVATHSLTGAIASGRLQGVLLTLSGDGNATYLSDSTGQYNFSAVPDGSYTVTPTLDGYTFTPANVTLTVNGASATIGDFDSACSICSTSIMLDGTVTPIASEPVTKANGGTVAVAGAVQLAGTAVQIPAGSLPADTTITVAQVTDSPLVPTGVLVTDIGPTGTQLVPTLPATISIKYDPAYVASNNINDTATLKVVSFDPNVAAETLTPILPVDTAQNLVTATTTHFSNFAVLGYSNASLKGYYHFVNYFFNPVAVPQTAPAVGNPLPTPKGFTANDFTVGFDGNGNWSNYSQTRNEDGVVSTPSQSGNCSGTYTITADGNLSSFAGVTQDGTNQACGRNRTGQVLAGGSILISSSQTAGQVPDFQVGVQIVDSNYSNASLNGTYNYVGITANSQAPQGVAPAAGSPLPALSGLSSTLGTITFDGNGNSSETDSSITNGIIQNASGTGTYSVASDGTVTTGPGGKGQLLAGGDVMIVRGYGNGSDPAVYFLLKQQPGNYSNATLTGAYTLMDYSYDHLAAQPAMPTPGQPLPPPNGFQGLLATMTFDGAGSYTLAGSGNIDGVIGAWSNIGTYSVASDGTLTFNDVANQFTGHVLANGSTFVVSATTAGQISEIAAGLTK